MEKNRIDSVLDFDCSIGSEKMLIFGVSNGGGGSGDDDDDDCEKSISIF